MTGRTTLASRRADREFLTLVPVFIGLAVGGVMVVSAGSRLQTLLGLAIVGLTLLFSEVRAVKLALLTIVLLEIPLQIDRYLGHDLVEAATSAISGYNISLTTLGLIALYGIWLTEAIAGSSRTPSRALTMCIPAFVYVGIAVISLSYAGNPQLAQYEVVILVQALMLLVYLAHAVRTRQAAMYVVAVLIFGVLIQIGLSAYAFAGGSTVKVGVVSIEIAGNRLAGTLGHPNSLGGYMAMLLPLTAAMVLAPVTPWLRWLSAGAFVGGSILLGLSQSRGGFIGYLVGLGVLAGLAYVFRLVPRSVLVRGGLIALVPLAAQLAVVGSRLLAIDNEASLSRLPLLELASTMIADNLLVGVGANNFAASLSRYLTIEYSSAWIDTVHNKYALVWAEVGILGLLAFLWLLLATLVRAFGVARSAERTIALIGAGLMAGLMASMTHMFVDIYNGRPGVQMLFVFCGLVIALAGLRPVHRSDPARGVPRFTARDHGARPQRTSSS